MLNNSVIPKCDLTFKAPRCNNASFYIPGNILNFRTTKGFRMTIPMKQFCQCVAISFNFLSTSSHLHPVQVANCDSNSRLAVHEDDNGKFRPERVSLTIKQIGNDYNLV